MKDGRKIDPNSVFKKPRKIKKNQNNKTQWNLVWFPQQEEMYIFMEYCDEGTLEEVSKLGLQEHVIRLYSKQITIAINVLHEHGIVHRDIKGNVNHKR